MKKLIIICISIFITAFSLFQLASAQTVLFPSRGGTGIGSATGGDIGLCLKVANNAPFAYELGACGAGGGGGGSGGTWSTTTSQVANRLINYPNNATDIVTIGSNATTTAEFFYDPNTLIGHLKGFFGIGTTSPYAPLSVVGAGGVVAEKFTATSTTATSTINGDLLVRNLEINAFAEHTRPAQSQTTVINDMDTGWTDFYAKGTVVHDSSVYVEGDGSVKLTLASDGTNTGMRFNITDQDLSKKSFRFYVRSDDWTNVASMSLLISTSGTFASFYSINLKSFLTSPANNEWIEIVVPRSNFSGSGTPNWTTANDLIVRGTSSGGNTPNVWFDSLNSFEEAKKPVVSIVFDDGYDTTNTIAKPIMDEHGFVGTAYIEPHLLGVAGRVNQQQVDALHYAGWDISGHYDTTLTSLTTQQLDSTLRNIKNYLSGKGYRGADQFAYPGGIYNDKVKEYTSKYFASARNIDGMTQTLNVMSPMQINGYTINNNTATSTLIARIDNATTTNNWTILVFHKLTDNPTVSTEYSTYTFDYILDYLKTNNITVLPVSEVMKSDWNRDFYSIGNNLVYNSGFIGIGTTSPGTALGVMGKAVIADDVTSSRYVATSTATSTFVGGIQANIFNATSATASSTFANGINLTGGCFSINGSCVTGGGSSTGASTTLLVDSNTFSGLTKFTSTGTTTFGGGIQGTYLNLTGASTATSTASNGFNLTSGCFSIRGTCITGGGGGGGSGTVTELTAGSGITFSSGATCTTTCTISATGGGTNYFTNIGANTILNTGTTINTPALVATSTTLDSSFVSNVGIGTTSPVAKLAVAEGSIHVSEFTVSTSTAITVDWASSTPSVSSNQQLIRIGTSALTINMKSYNAGQSLKLVVCNPSSGTAGTITWDSNILWPGSVAPGQTTTANKCDVWSFIATMATSSLKIFGGVTTSF